MRKKKPINLRVGKNIQQAREQAGYTQEELSELLDLSPNHLSAIERGASGVTLETLEQLCKLLRVSADDLIFGGMEPPSDRWGFLLAQLNEVDEQYHEQIRNVLMAVLQIIRAKSGH